MKNQNTPLRRAWRWLQARWRSEDYPGAEPRFQIQLLAKDILVFVAIPILSVLIYSMVSAPKGAGKKSDQGADTSRNRYQTSEGKSQIIEFAPGRRAGSMAAAGKRAPGVLVRLRLLNVVETYTTAPVHAQIVDAGLGAGLLGGILIGDATPDTNFERISINFKYARDPRREEVAFPVAARALSLDGTLGLAATKKEGFLARSVFGTAGSATQDAQGKFGGTGDFGQILLKALSAGLAQEFGGETQVERNRSQVLVLAPSSEFFAELTDFFPGSAK